MDVLYFLVMDESDCWIIVGQTRARNIAEAIVNIQRRYGHRITFENRNHYRIMCSIDEMFEVVHDFSQSQTNVHDWVLEGF